MKLFLVVEITGDYYRPETLHGVFTDETLAKNAMEIYAKTRTNLARLELWPVEADDPIGEQGDFP